MAKAEALLKSAVISLLFIKSPMMLIESTFPFSYLDLFRYNDLSTLHNRIIALLIALSAAPDIRLPTPSALIADDSDDIISIQDAREVVPLANEPSDTAVDIDDDEVIISPNTFLECEKSSATTATPAPSANSLNVATGCKPLTEGGEVSKTTLPAVTTAQPEMKNSAVLSSANSSVSAMNGAAVARSDSVVASSGLSTGSTRADVSSLVNYKSKLPAAVSSQGCSRVFIVKGTRMKFHPKLPDMLFVVIFTASLAS
jgi:hypothetical protein